MNEIELCRLCANFADETNSENLFDGSQRNLLQQAEELTGLELNNGADLPQFICMPCQEQTQQAYEFRERCIRVQKHFAKAASYQIQYKSQTRMQNKLLDECEFKEEKEEVEYEVQLPPVEEILIEKDEIEFKPITIEIHDALLSVEPLLNTNESSNDEWNTTLPMLDVDYVEMLEENDRLEEASTFEPHFEASPISPLTSKVMSTSRRLSVRHAGNNRGRRTTTANDDHTGSPTTKHNAKTKRTARDSSEQKLKPKVDLRKCKTKQHFICDQCGRNFNSHSYFVLHLSRHAGDKQFKCELCPDKFFTKADLRRHTYKHTGERPIPCRFCDRRFIDHSLRTKHEKTHTNERPHVCNECGKRFNQKQHLDCHMQLHTGERFFSCALCDTTFQRKSNMTAHFSTMLHKQNLEKQKLKKLPSNTAESADISNDLLNVC